jgi:adenylate cyclase
MAKLVIFDSGGRREVELSEHNPVGRHPQNRVQILDRVVSKEHCLVYRDQVRGYMIKDYGSLNGTYVNKARATEDIELSDGDEITLGNTRCMFLGNETVDKAAKMVNVSESEVQSHIHSKIEGISDRFLPEGEIEDNKALRADYEKLRVVHELQRDIGLELDLDTLLTRILEQTFKFLNCDRGVILMPDDEGEFRPRSVKTKKEDDKLIISSTLLNQVRKEKAGVLSSDAMMDNRFKEARSIIMQGIRSSMAVPILHRDDLLGIMLIDSSVAISAFTEKDLHLLSNIANQTAQFIKNAQMATKIEKDATTREQFSRLLSPDLAEMVVSGELKVEKGGENREATVLFADIRGFTSMSENMDAGDVLHMLNEYFEIMVDVVFHHEGTVDKFVGDEIMVIWGAPVKHNDDPIRAVRAAIDMQLALTEFNRTRASEGLGPIHVGIGVNTGKLVAGYIGSSRTMSYSVIGDTVNTGARLCSAAKAGEVIISAATQRFVKKEFQLVELEPVTVKGKAKPISIYKALGESSLGKTKATDLTAAHKLPVN